MHIAYNYMYAPVGVSIARRLLTFVLETFTRDSDLICKI